MANPHYRNISGHYDPTVGKVIDQENRDTQVKRNIDKAYASLRKNDLVLVERMKIKDLRTGKIYK